MAGRFNFEWRSEKQSDWARDQAHTRRISIAEVVREALDDAQRKSGNITTAEYIARLLRDDGQRFETEDGRTLGDLAEAAEARVAKHETKELWRYRFPDGSAIIAAPGAWDIEGTTPFSWAGAE